MNIEFILQGLDEEHFDSTGNYIIRSISKGDFNKFKFFSAYLSKSAVKVIDSSLKENNILPENVEFYIGIDDEGTSIEALESLHKASYPTYLINQNAKNKRSIYHPKVYLFKGDEYERAIIGSSNLTQSGLFYNIESSLQITVKLSSKKKNPIRDIEKKVEHFLKSKKDNIIELNNKTLELLKEGNILTSEKEYFTESKRNKHQNKDNLFEATKIKGVSLQKLKEKLPTKQNRNKRKHPITKKSRDNEYIRYIENNWNTYFPLLKKYKDQKGNTIVSRDYDNQQLYSFVSLLKRLNRKELLKQEKIDLLNSIDFIWIDGHKYRLDKLWEEIFIELVEYKKKFGDTSVPRGRKENQYSRLGGWVAHQRTRYKKGLQTEERIKRLDELGFSWVGGKKGDQDDIWLDRIIALNEFKRRNGHCNPSQVSTDPEEKKLGVWLNVQRVSRKRKKISQDRIDILSEIGVVWDTRNQIFEEKLVEIIKFKEENGHFNIPSTYYENISLGTYVYRLRKKTYRLEPWQIEKLNKIGFDWLGDYRIRGKDPISDSWYRSSKQLTYYAGLLNINQPRNDWEDKKIANWIYRQKKRYEEGKLQDGQIKILEDLGIKWKIISTSDKKWEIRYNIYKKYVKSHDKLTVSIRDNPKIHEWISRQYRVYRGNRLSDYRQKKLEELGVKFKK